MRKLLALMIVSVALALGFLIAFMITKSWWVAACSLACVAAGGLYAAAGAAVGEE